jgi:hypothetical protein
MTVNVADAHVHVPRFISVVKMATVLEEYTTEEQGPVVRLLWKKKNSMQMTIIKKYFLFAVGGVCRVKRFTAGIETSQFMFYQKV